ncbi:MAG: single-stranded-DNA-specific exonuclease RecJ, partial [Methylophilaceae bacterium]
SELLDLVALGTVADLVKLDKNNRILVEYGLNRIRSGHACPGIQALFQISGRDTHYANTQDLGFSLGPRINAAGRLEDISLGISCLMAEALPQALQIAQQLNDINLQRKDIEQEIKFSAQSLLAKVDIEQRYTICLFDASWHHGVIGVVASRIKESWYRPVIVFAPDEHGMLRGSGRSIPQLHLRDALDAVSKLDPDVMVKFGGHAMAAGLTIRPEKFELFSNLFEQIVANLLTPDDLHQ